MLRKPRNDSRGGPSRGANNSFRAERTTPTLLLEGEGRAEGAGWGESASPVLIPETRTIAVSRPCRSGAAIGGTRNLEPEEARRQRSHYPSWPGQV